MLLWQISLVLNKRNAEEEKLEKFKQKNQIKLAKQGISVIQGLQLGGGKGAIAIQAALAAADSYLSYNQALISNTAWAASLGPIAGPPYKAAADLFATKSLAISLGGIAAKGVLQLNDGGIVPGGAPYVDKVPAMLTPGEVVLNPRKGGYY